MPIKVSCPQCQKVYISPRRQARQASALPGLLPGLLGGPPPGRAPPEGEAPPEPPPAPARKPAARSAVKPAAAARAGRAPKPAPKPPIRRKRPGSQATPAAGAPQPARPHPPSRRAAAPPRKSSRGVMGLLFLLLLVLLAGGGAAALAFMALTGKLPFVAAVTLPDSHPAAPAPPKKDDRDPQTPNPPADAPKPAPGSLAASLTRENFDKIDRGVTDAVLVELFGPPTSTEESKQAGADKDLIWKVGAGGPQVTVSMKGGRVVAKSSGQDWPVVYPSGVAANPPPDKDPPPPPDQPDPAKLAAAVTKATFDKIAKGMTEADLKKLLGPPNFRMPDPGVDGVDLMLAWRTPNRGDIPGPSITVFMAAGAVRDKLGGDANHWEVVWPGDVAANPPPPLPPPPPDNAGPGVTKDTYAKIAKGMSLAELTALLGPPTDVKKTPDVPAYDTYVTWQPGGLRGPDRYRDAQERQDGPEGQPAAVADQLPPLCRQEPVPAGPAHPGREQEQLLPGNDGHGGQGRDRPVRAALPGPAGRPSE